MAIALFSAIFVWAVVNVFYEPYVEREKVVPVKVNSTTDEVVIVEPSYVKVIAKGPRISVLKYLASLSYVIWDGHFVYPEKKEVEVVIESEVVKVKKFPKLEKKFRISPVLFVPEFEVESVRIYPEFVEVKGIKDDVEKVKAAYVAVKRFGRSISSVKLLFATKKLKGKVHYSPKYVLVEVKKKVLKCRKVPVIVLYDTGEVVVKVSPSTVEVCGYEVLPKRIVVDLRSRKFLANTVFYYGFERNYATLEIKPSRVRVFVRKL